MTADDRRPDLLSRLTGIFHDRLKSPSILWSGEHHEQQDPPGRHAACGNIIACDMNGQPADPFHRADDWIHVGSQNIPTHPCQGDIFSKLGSPNHLGVVGAGEGVNPLAEHIQPEL